MSCSHCGGAHDGHDPCAEHRIKTLEAETERLFHRVIALTHENDGLKKRVEQLAHEPIEVVRMTSGNHGDMSRKTMLRLLPHLVARSHHVKVLLKLERAREALIAIRDFNIDAAHAHRDDWSDWFFTVVAIAAQALQPEHSSSEVVDASVWR